jgi:hypothetical protein
MTCNHDYDNAIRLGRANWVCPKCKKDITLEFVLMHEAGLIGDKK